MKLFVSTSMPQMIPQSGLNQAYVDNWRRYAERALRGWKKDNVLSPVVRKSTKFTLYHKKKSNTSGVWFLSEDAKKIDFLYAYSSAPIFGKPHSVEALAYRFSEYTRGQIRDVFFDYLLPNSGFVVTDSQYTDDGHRWFQAEYVHAFNNGYKVYAIDLGVDMHARLINVDEFWALQDKYWGQDDEHQKYRFAIESK